MRSRILILALGTFAVGADGFVIAGILGRIASDLDVSVEAAGQLETVFSITIAIVAPVLMTALGRFSPKTMMVGSMAVFTAANVAAAIAPGFASLMVFRVLAAAAVGVYAASAPTAAVMLAPEEQRGRALSTVTAGMTAGIVLGVPAGILVNNLSDWRGTFVFVSVLGLLALVGVLVGFPSVPTPPPVGMAERVGALRNPAILVMLLNIAVWMVGGYTLYVYMGPMLEGVPGFAGNSITLIFLGFGVASVVGNVLGGVLTDRIGPTKTLLTGLAGGGAGLALTSLFGSSPVGVLVALMLWSTAGWMLVPAQQYRLIGVAPQLTPILMSLNASAMYLGIGLGAVVGGLVSSQGSLRDLGWVGSLWEVAAIVLVLISARLATRVADRQPGPERPAVSA